MSIVLVAVGLALVFIGYAVERREGRFTPGKAVGLTLFVVGEVLLFGERWWWGLIGLIVPPILIETFLAAARKR